MEQASKTPSRVTREMINWDNKTELLEIGKGGGNQPNLKLRSTENYSASLRRESPLCEVLSHSPDDTNVKGYRWSSGSRYSHLASGGHALSPAKGIANVYQNYQQIYSLI